MIKYWISCAVATLLLLGAAGRAAAADTPFSGSLDVSIIATTIPREEDENDEDDVLDIKMDLLATVGGQSSLLGNFSGWVSYTLNLTTGHFSGTMVKVAANGDQLFEDITGSFTDASGTNSIGHFTITQGTGRFKNATGEGDFTGVFSSPVEGKITFDGNCNFSASNRARSPSANSSAYQATGQVIFSNIQNGLSLGQPVPYIGVSSSTLTGLGVQTGSIQATTPLRVVGPNRLEFDGVVGPHPVLGTNVHVITTAKGDIHSTWTAVFTLQYDASGTVTFSGDAQFTVTGGTGIYRNATGNFRTLFTTEAVAPTSDTASAKVNQSGNIAR